MPRKHRVNPFVDIEAEVDDQDIDSESDPEDTVSSLGEFCYFIAEEIEDDNESTSYKTWADLLREDELEQEEETASFLRHLQNRLNQSPTDTRIVAGRSADGTISTPAYPIYRVACKPGHEENVLFYLYQKIQSERIASIIVRPTIVGYVYIEGMLDEAVKAILMKTPGVRKTRNGPVMEGIAQGDWSKLLSMNGRAERAVTGEWVTIRDGSIYEGDIGLVVRVESWGVELLVVPRIPSVITNQQVLDVGGVLKKRKRSLLQNIPEPRLWLEPEEAKARGWDVEELSAHCYKVGTSKFEYGLLRGCCSFFGIRPSPPLISSSAFFQFASSNHPSVVTAQYRSPKPQEWAIHLDDLITDIESGRRGRVRKIEVTFAEMEAEDKSGIFSVPWKALRKEIKTGDYVEIVNGPFKERSGWVVSLKGDVATIVNTRNHDVSHVEAHINWTIISSTPFIGCANQSSKSSILPRENLPWIGQRVLIVKTAHKGRHGTIKNWFNRGDSEYGLIVRIEEYNPNAPFHDITLEYEDVVEPESQKKLREYFMTRHMYIPHPSTATPLNTQASDLANGSQEKVASASSHEISIHTPMHVVSTSSSSPAWDPNSSTPLSQEANSPTQVTAPPTHELLDQQLIGMTFKVNIHGGGIPGTAMVVTVMQRENGTLGLRGTRQGKECWFEPGWVYPRRPVHNRGDNGPMVVTRGSRCGTHIRRITSRYDGVRHVMQCIVISYSEEQADTETEEVLLLEPDEVVLRSESQVEKARNQPLTARLRLRAKRER
ncbi:hypothetical protein BJ165DRAFT_1558794 [Panaeolus papilionaceus]|nr:hypothetical protein BJ165DRAFT_1558794 [Panaeolus papilionaceus]